MQPKDPNRMRPAAGHHNTRADPMPGLVSSHFHMRGWTWRMTGTYRWLAAISVGTFPCTNRCPNAWPIS